MSSAGNLNDISGGSGRGYEPNHSNLAKLRERDEYEFYVELDDFLAPLKLRAERRLARDGTAA